MLHTKTKSSDFTVSQTAVVSSAPRVQSSVCGDGGAVGAATGDVHHVLPGLLPGKRRNHHRLVQIPAKPSSFDLFTEARRKNPNRRRFLQT